MTFPDNLLLFLMLIAAPSLVSDSHVFVYNERERVLQLSAELDDLKGNMIECIPLDTRSDTYITR